MRRVLISVVALLSVGVGSRVYARDAALGYARMTSPTLPTPTLPTPTLPTPTLPALPALTTPTLPVPTLPSTNTQGSTSATSSIAVPTSPALTVPTLPAPAALTVPTLPAPAALTVPTLPALPTLTTPTLPNAASPGASSSANAGSNEEDDDSNSGSETTVSPALVAPVVVMPALPELESPTLPSLPVQETPTPVTDKTGKKSRNNQQDNAETPSLNVATPQELLDLLNADKAEPEIVFPQDARKTGNDPLRYLPYGAAGLSAYLGYRLLRKPKTS